MGNFLPGLKRKEKYLETPWRSVGDKDVWSKRFRTELMNDIKDFKPHGDLEYAKLQLLGPVNAGKSSIINSIKSIDKGRIATAALAGAADSSFTTMLEQLIPNNHIGGQYRIVDVMGLEDVEGRGFHVEDVMYLMEGNIKPSYKFKPERPINPESDPEFIQNPTLKDQPQCSAITIDSSQITRRILSDEGKARLKQLQKFIREKSPGDARKMTQSIMDVAVVILLTKIDIICKEEGIDITKIYKSTQIKELVDIVADIFGVQKMQIFPVQNYTEASILDDHIDILHLMALQKMLHITNDRLEYKENQTK